MISAFYLKYEIESLIQNVICLNEPLPQITYVHSANPFFWSKPEAKILMKSNFMSSK